VIVRLKRAWTDFWFQPESAGNLALARILVALNALWMLASRNYAGMSDVPDAFWRAAPAAIRWRYLIVPGHGDIERVLQGLAAIVLIGALLGIAPRVCCAVAALLLYHLAPLEAAIWTAAPEGRGMTLAPTALLILAAAPSGDAFALWPRARTGSKERRASRYGWALLLIQLLVCEIYFFSAIGKLERTGLAWGSAERMRLWLFWFNQDTQSVVFGTLGPWLAQYAWLCGLIGAATVVMEWTMPLALFWRPSRVVLVPVALAFHVGVLLSMNIHVPEAWLILVFVDWTGLSRRLRRMPGITPPK
jgi:hypothetical protein